MPRPYVASIVVALTVGVCANVLAGSPAELTVHLEYAGRGAARVAVLYLAGEPYEMGYFHGRLAGRRIVRFYDHFLRAAVMAMGITYEDLDAAWAAMAPFVPQEIKQEMRGLAEGAGVPLRDVQRVHAIGDLSEYHCTFFAAWGRATADGHLHQIRALDYYTELGIQRYPAVFVYYPRRGVPFAQVGYLGYLGALAGMNAAHIAISTIGDSYGDDKETLAGEPFIFTSRRVLQGAETLEQAVEIVRRARRTSSFLYCLGDGKIPRAVAMQTCRDFAYVYDDWCLPNRQLRDVVYFSMTASSPWNEKIYDWLKPRWGKIRDGTGRELMRECETGNLHAVEYDVTDLEMWVANARPGGAPAYDQPYVRLDLKQLFARGRRMLNLPAR